MSADKRVLLARPHAFIVKEMGPFLSEAGFAAVQVEDADQLERELSSSFHGAIISTAVTSAVSADAATVFRLIRERSPHLPVVFAGMADFETVMTTAGRAVRTTVADPLIIGPRDYRRPATTASRASTFLVLRKEDLMPGASRDAALSALRAHLGQGHP